MNPATTRYCQPHLILQVWTRGIIQVDVKHTEWTNISTYQSRGWFIIANSAPKETESF